MNLLRYHQEDGRDPKLRINTCGFTCTPWLIVVHYVLQLVYRGSEGLVDLLTLVPEDVFRQKERSVHVPQLDHLHRDQQNVQQLNEVVALTTLGSRRDPPY